MSYIGNQPISTAFQVDTFSGNGSTVAFTMSVAPANTSSVLVSITGVVQDPSTYSVSGTTLTFSAAPPSGTSNISVRYLGIPASGVTTTAYRTQTEFTATAGQTTFTVPSYTVGFIDVYRNGLLLGSADFTATTGTTVVLAAAASAGDFIETVSFYVSSVLNALPQTGGTLSGNLAIQGAETLTGAVATNGASFSGASLVAGRVDSSNEGGQVDLCRASDNASAWAIDVFGNTSTPTLRFVDNIAAAARMVIDASGNLIVNGTSPVGKLTVSGQSTDANNVLTGANITAGTQLCLRERGNSVGISGLTYTEQIYSGPAGGALELYTVQATPVVFGTSATERARIDSSGNLLLMTTSSSITADVGIKFVNGSSGNAYMGIVNSQSTNASANYHLYSTGAGAYRFYVGMGGTIYATSTSISALSDQTLKTNIRDLETGLTEVMALKPRRFDWINGDATNVAGFVAQEVEQVLPELVTDYIHNKDEEGNDITKKSLKMGDILPTLVKAIQEQQAIIEQLQADVAALKGQA